MQCRCKHAGLHTNGQTQMQAAHSISSKVYVTFFTLVPSWLLTGENWEDRNTAGQGPVLGIPGSLCCASGREDCAKRGLSHTSQSNTVYCSIPAHIYKVGGREQSMGLVS